MFYLLSDETRLKIVAWARRSGRKLRWIGGGLALFSAIAPWLLVLEIIESTYFICFLIYFCMVLGMGLSVVGLLYDNFVDLSK